MDKTQVVSSEFEFRRSRPPTTEDVNGMRPPKFIGVADESFVLITLTIAASGDFTDDDVVDAVRRYLADRGMTHGYGQLA